jgi:hypothetical protein
VFDRRAASEGGDAAGGATDWAGAASAEDTEPEDTAAGETSLVTAAEIAAVELTGALVGEGVGAGGWVLAVAVGPIRDDVGEGVAAGGAAVAVAATAHSVFG